MLLVASLGHAAPVPLRGLLPRPRDVYWEEGRIPDVLRVKFRGEPRWPALAGAVPRRLAMTDWYTLRSAEAEAIGTELLADPEVETAFLAYAPVPPPGDIAPFTDDFRPLQTWLDPFPGLGLAEAARWPGGTGANVTIADLEYGWAADHEDLERAPAASAWGWDSGLYGFHGTSVLGMLVGTPNGYGIDGAVPDATALVISPFEDEDGYDVAAAVSAAIDLLRPGDVLLIEQQAYALGTYCPVSVDPAVFEAIASATEAGIVVVEPAGNGGADLDAFQWEGAFDRAVRDSGSIMVGGGASPGSGLPPRAWYSGGSAYGARVDVQGWYDGIVTTTGGEYDGYYADLYYPEGDARQAYTLSFSGTSGASPMIAAIAAIAQSVSIELTGEPWRPADLRAAIVATGTPQAGEPHIGPLPDLRRLLRSYFLE